MLNSIRQKIICSAFSLGLVIIAVFAFTSYFRTINAMQMEIQKHGTAIVKTFTQMATTYIFESDYITLLDNANELIENSDILEVTILDTHGKIWVSTDTQLSGKLNIEPFYQDILTRKKITHRKIMHNGQTVMEFVSPIVALGKVLYFLKIEISLKDIQNQVAGRINDIIIISLGMIVLAIFLGIFLSQLVTDPLKKLVKGTNEISQGNLNYKIKVYSSDEIGTLTKSFNLMTDNLRKELSKRKQAEEKIERARDELEIRVKERTAELQQQIEDRIIAEEKYRMLMEASSVSIVVYDMNGIPDYINPAFTQTFGWTLEDLKGRKIDFVPEKEMPHTLEMIERLKRGERYQGFETRRYNNKRESLDVSISFDVWRERDGTPKGSVVILHDVTHRKQLEMQLFQSRKMEAVGTLAGGIAHDFNNILSGIVSYSQLAEMHVENPERAKKHICQILKGAKRAAGLVQQILAFSRKTDYQKQPVEFYRVVKEVLKLQRSSLPPAIEIKENIFSRAMVRAESTQMHQIITNLCTNAAHAMPEKGGVLTVVLEEIEVSGQARLPDMDLLPGRYLKLTVKDNGHGMDKKTLEKAFDLYFTTKEVGKGTGFGLALVQAIVEEHKGYIKADSAPGKGASFYIYLPIVPIVENKHDVRSLEHTVVNLTGGTETIMVIDDDVLILSATQEMLEDYGYIVMAFHDAKQAFDAFKRNPYQFDLIITDMAMPGMTGDALSVSILTLRNDVPIILCTGYSETISEGKALELGIQKYLQKPVESQTLLLLIRELLENNIETWDSIDIP